MISIILFALFVAAVAILIHKSSTPKDPAAESNKLLKIIRGQAVAHHDYDAVAAIDAGTYSGMAPVRKPDGTYPNIYSDFYTYKISGLNYVSDIKEWVGEFCGYIKADTKNAYDPDAIAIFHRNGHRLGYIPRDETGEVRKITAGDFPFPIWGSIELSDDASYCYGEIHIEIPTPPLDER